MGQLRRAAPNRERLRDAPAAVAGAAAADRRCRADDRTRLARARLIGEHRSMQREQKITLREMRESGPTRLLVYCGDPITSIPGGIFPPACDSWHYLPDD